jgi:hypothetical protein
MAYSNLAGSFERKTNQPLEANYIFPTYSDLVNFYTSDPRSVTDPYSGTSYIEEFNEGRKNLHEGLLKLVLDNSDDSNVDSKNKGNPSLYWAIQDGIDVNGFPKWEWRFLISDGDIEYLKTEMADGDIIARIVGAPTWNDVPDTLDNLPSNYNNLKKISEYLNWFFTERDPSDSSINTWLELLDFLKEFKDDQTLKEILQEIYNYIDKEFLNIYGDPLPSEDFRTLRGIEDWVRVDSCEQWHVIGNLQTELNATQTGVGLDGNGNYQADQGTNYLTHAKSVMHALRILDALIKKLRDEVNTILENCCGGGGTGPDTI